MLSYEISFWELESNDILECPTQSFDIDSLDIENEDKSFM